MNLRFEWRKPRTQFASGEYLLVNGVMLGSFSWMKDVTGDGYMGFSRLPEAGISDTKYDTVEEVKTVVENAIRKWFERFK